MSVGTATGIVGVVYSHIIDDDRRINAQRFEDTFYNPKEPTISESEAADSQPIAQVNAELVAQLIANPGFLTAVQKAMNEMKS